MAIHLLYQNEILIRKNKNVEQEIIKSEESKSYQNYTKPRFSIIGWTAIALSIYNNRVAIAEWLTELFNW